MKLARDVMDERDESLDEFSERMGWGMAAALDDPPRFRDDYPLDALIDLCGGIGIDWREALLDAIGHAAMPSSVDELRD
jgi:hypothetical protein